ncbi:MAG: translation initiation factor IF-3 [Fibrobacteres bacterium]|nr:translation initiation factor IF-3 [Fibrobacterota bacterium]
MIRVPSVRLIGKDGEQVGIVNTREALIMAQEAELDLIEISPTAQPPVCKIGDFGKYKYELTKKQKDARKKQHIVHLKELKMHPKTEQNDYSYRIKHAREFLADGDRVRITIVFKGREMAYLEFGKRLLDRAAQDLADIADVEVDSSMEGRNMFSIFTIKKTVYQKIKSDKERLEREQKKAEAKDGE